MKFPFYRQLDGMDCGPTCLRMIARYYGKKFSVQQLRENSYIQRTGVNLLGISEAAESIGLRTTGIRTTIDKLKQQSKLPCILHWNQMHFVVLYRVEESKGKTFFHIADPAYGLLKYEISLLVQAKDLFNTSAPDITMFSGNRTLSAFPESRRSFSITLRYKFNAVKSKYKGTGAGDSQKKRL